MTWKLSSTTNPASDEPAVGADQPSRRWPRRPSAPQAPERDDDDVSPSEPESDIAQERGRVTRGRRLGSLALACVSLALVPLVVISSAPARANARSLPAAPQHATTPINEYRPRPDAPLVRTAPTTAPKRHQLTRTVQARPRTAVMEPQPITISVAGVATGEQGQAAVNRCAGPVEVLWSAYGYANDIIQHNYCGGAWMAYIRPGTHIRIVGGTQPGLYVANGQRRVAPWGSTIAVMAGIGDLAVQTCVGHDLVYVGLTRV